MKRLLQVFIFSGLFLTSLAQNIERGCTHIDHFSVYSGSPTLYQYPPYDYEFFDQCISHFFHSDEDTLFLELSDTNAIFMEWRFWDEYGFGPFGEYSNTPYWYINDTLVDSLHYSSYYYLHGGACGVFAKAGSTLSTKVPGAYELRYLGNLKTNLPVIVVKAPLAQIVETETSVQVSIFPNPANNSLNVTHGNLTNGVATIYDLNGRLIETFVLENSPPSNSLNISRIKNGHYILIVQSDQVEVFKGRFVKL